MSASAWGSEGVDSLLREGGLFDCGGMLFIDGVEGDEWFTGGEEGETSFIDKEEGEMSFPRPSETERETHARSSETDRETQPNNPPLQLQASGTHEYIETSLISPLASE